MSTIAALLLCLLCSSSAEGSVVTVLFVGKQRCTNCEDFLRGQVIPTWRRLGSTGRVNISYIPYSLCSRHGDFDTSCATDGRALQVCIMSQMPVGYYETILCAHNEDEIDGSLARCDFRGLDKERLRSCATGKEGMELLSWYQRLSLDLVASVGLDTWTYPVLVVDGVRNRAMERNLLGELCDRHLIPRPSESDAGVKPNEPKFW